jgi:LuxR family maltose regulon positive regulatory protein
MASVPLVLSRRPRFGREIERDRLLAACDGAAVVVLAAPGGSGKSVLAGQLCDRSPRRTLWCRLAPGYDDAADLVATALQSAGATPPDEIGVVTDVLELAGTLLELLEAEATVLVVDDYHQAEGGRCDQLLAEVITLLPDDVTVVVCCRTRPAALLGRIAAIAPVVLGNDALAFDGDETGSLFELHGRDAGAVAVWTESTGGWAAALTLVAEGTLTGDVDPAASGELAAALLADPRLASHHDLLRGLAVLPYVTAELAAALDLGSGAALAQLGGLTSLASDADGFWRLHPSVAEAILATLDASQVGAIRSAAAAALAATDPATAIELHLGVGDAEAAADVLADHLSEVGTDHAMRWLYVMPAEVRRRFPPALSAGRATVNLDVAIVTARERVQRATEAGRRREALLALGSVHAGRGELADAADALEAAARLAVPGGAATAAIHTQLALVRWWAGDLDGAAAALENAGAGVWPAWIDGQLALVRGDAGAVADAGRRSVEAASDPGATDAPGRSLLAIAALLDGRLDDAAAEAAEAYRTALDVGGLDLAAAATAHGWALLRTGRADEAEAVIDVLQRQVGRQDHHARVQAALLASARSEGSGDTERIERDARRLYGFREAGYAPLEAAAQLLAGRAATEAGLAIRLLGEHVVEVDGERIPTSAWKSKKALEVLLWLGLAGAGGARREQVIEAVWPGREPEKGRTLLRTALSEIRRVLEPNRHRGEPSRFVTVDGDRVAVDASSDVTAARSATGSPGEAFDRVAPGLVTDLPDADWVDELRRELQRLGVEAAERVVAAGDQGRRVAALDVLFAAEPWNRAHVDALVEAHRAAGDEVAARAVERRWFEDDD